MDRQRVAAPPIVLRVYAGAGIAGRYRVAVDARQAT